MAIRSFTTMSSQGGRTIWTNDAKVGQATVITDAVNMVKYEGHLLAMPPGVLTAEFANGLFNTFFQQSFFESGPRIG